MFSWKRWGFIGAGAVAAILFIYGVSGYLDLSIFTDYWYTYTIVILIAYAGLFLRGFYYYKKSQWEMYPKIKKRALDAAKEKDGIITFNDLGKVPSRWYDWLIGKFREEDIAITDPRSGEKILFPEIIAESYKDNPKGVVDLDLPADIGANIMRMAESKQKTEE